MPKTKSTSLELHFRLSTGLLEWVGKSFVGVVDELAPMVKYTNNEIKSSISQAIKHKQNERKRLLKSKKRFTTNSKVGKIKS